MAIAWGCEPRQPAPPVKRDALTRGEAPAIDGAIEAVIDASIDGGAAAKVFVHSSTRCGECHEKMVEEWEKSAHARAVTSRLYKAARAAAKDATCDRCHAPLVPAVARDAVGGEGVTCDVCHTLRDPLPAATGAGFRLAIDDMIRFGPRCDLKDHYFHRMGCSPEHKQALLCGSCHWWERDGVPVFTEYLDWRVGPAANVPCQGCHMPTERAALATGSPVRAGVPHHGMLGITGDLRARALGLAVTVRNNDGALAVTVTLKNSGGGHAVPSGLPERRVEVRVRVKGRDGTQGEHETRALGRVLVDAAGTEVPFWRATRVGSDTRIAPGASWEETFSFHPSGAGTIEVEVVHRALSDAAAKILGVTDLADLPMTSARIPFGPNVALPRTVTVKPPVAGKRPR